MRNLFILHTQYNLILGTGILQNLYKDEENDLILYSEFNVSQEYKKKLGSVYCNILYIRDNFEPQPKGRINVEKHFYGEYKIFKCSPIAAAKYDNIFIAQDRPLESLIVGYFKKRFEFKCYNIEEDCYYSIDPQKNDVNYRSPFRTRFSYYTRKLLYGSKYIHQSPLGYDIYGQSDYFNGIYALYPDQIRPHLQKHQTLNIRKEVIIKGVEALYSDISISIPEAHSYVLFFFDLIERYKDPAKISTLFSEICCKAKEEGKQILIKYHPRETQKFEVDDSVVEIPFLIPAEKLLVSLYGKNVKVIGNATTAIVVARKLGFDVDSILRLNGEKNEYLINFYKRIGINIL